jgi:enediyne biosynthesis protein E4
MRTRRFCLVEIFLGLCLCFSTSPAQTFTKITIGSLVNDGGASRSVNWIDVNNDGYLDLFVSNGLEGGEDNFLYVNNGPDSNFTFRKITNSPLVLDGLPSDGSSWGDVDNDGDLDAVVVAWYDSSNNFYVNDGGGGFLLAGSSPIVTDRGRSETCAWGDYDNDGYIDLYVTNSGGDLHNFLYHNNGDGTFTRIISGSLVQDQYKSRGCTWVDYDNDGDLDMFVVNESNQANDLYRNELKETGTATFTRITTGDLVTTISSSWSASWGDYDNDGDFDVFIATGYPLAANDMLYTNNGDGTFTRVLTGPLVSDGARSACATWGDVDNDGDLDLFVTTAYSATPTRNFLYMNRFIETGSATFEQVTTGDIVGDFSSSYGTAWGDYDQDGDLDLFVATTLNEASNNLLYRNDNANGNHWIELRCVGNPSNRSGIGAKIWIKASVNGSPVWQMREVDGQSGYCAQNLDLHVGLGSAAEIDSLKIEWPDGQVDWHTHVSINRIVSAHEGGALTEIRDQRNSVPSRFALLQNYPNPFNPKTNIRFVLAKSSVVSLKVFDVLGKQVASLVEGWRESGEHIVEFGDEHLASGVYVYSLQEGTAVENRKMLLLR